METESTTETSNRRGKTCIAVTNSGKPRYPCRLVSAIAQTLNRSTVRQKWHIYKNQKFHKQNKTGRGLVARASTCLRSGRESLDMPKNLIASGPVMRPSPSATPSIRRPHIQAHNSGKGIGDRGGTEESRGKSDLRPRARTTPGRPSGAPWSSCSRGTARSPWAGARRWPRSALPPGEASKTLRRGLTVRKQEQSFQMGFLSERAQHRLEEVVRPWSLARTHA